MREWLLGTENDSQENRALTHIIMEFNYYVQRTNWKGNPLSLNEFKRGVRAMEYIERIIAMKKANIERHDIKWNHIFKLLS